MSDNLNITQGSGTVIAADDILGVLHQRVKLTWGVDGTAVDASATNPLPVSVISVPLPSGAATAAKQPTIGTAGSASPDVLTIQGIASMTALKVDGSAVTQPISGIITANAGSGTFAVSAASLPLPTGAATSANQTTIIAALGAPTDSAWASGNGTQISLLKTIATAALDTTTASPVTIRTPCDVVSVTPTLDTAIYASGDTLFATTSFTGVRAADERAMLHSVAVVDKDDQKPALRLLFFKSNVTFGTINAAPSISDSDAANYLGHVDIAASDYVDLGGVSVACQKGISLLLESASGTTNVYVAAMLTAGTPTHTASGLVFNFGLVWS